MAPIQQAQSTVQRLKESRVGHFFAKYGRDRADDWATLIAFSTLFSIFPLIGALLTILGLVLQDEQKLIQLIDVINRVFPAQLADLLSFLSETKQITGLLGLVSLVGLLWSASNLFGTMARAFNHFYGVKDRGMIGQKVMAFGMIFVFLALIVVSVVASAAATFLLGFSADRSPIPVPGLGLLQSLLGWAVSVGAAFLLFLAVFRIVPNAPLSFRHVWNGALLSALLFALINQLFPLYLRFFGGGFQAYKTLGLFLLLMTWFYFLARILVLGCELNAFLQPLPATETAKESTTAFGREQPAPAKPAPEPRQGGFGRRLLRVAALASIALLVVQRLRRHE